MKSILRRVLKRENVLTLLLAIGAILGSIGVPQSLGITSERILLALLGVLALDTLIERLGYLDRIETHTIGLQKQIEPIESAQLQSRQQIEELIEALSESTTTIIESVQGVELRAFNSENDLLSYANNRLLEAQTQIDDLSWSPVTSLGHGLSETQSIGTEHLKHIIRVARKIPYREVYMFNHPRRVEKLRTCVIQEDLPGYSCAYYKDSQVPLLQFMVIDREEVIVLSAQFAAKLAIRHPHIVRLFAEYYDQVWNGAIPIKIGTTFRDENLIASILHENPLPTMAGNP